MIQVVVVVSLVCQALLFPFVGWFQKEVLLYTVILFSLLGNSWSPFPHDWFDWQEELKLASFVVVVFCFSFTGKAVWQFKKKKF